VSRRRYGPFLTVEVVGWLGVSRLAATHAGGSPRCGSSVLVHVPCSACCCAKPVRRAFGGELCRCCRDGHRSCLSRLVELAVGVTLASAAPSLRAHMSERSRTDCEHVDPHHRRRHDANRAFVRAVWTPHRPDQRPFAEPFGSRRRRGVIHTESRRRALCAYDRDKDP